jgi:two-component system sensor histidine kinase RcsD
VIQATINNELYEIRQFRSQVAPRTQIFIIRDQDREVLVNKKLKQAQRCMRKTSRGAPHLCSILAAPSSSRAKRWRQRRRR